MSIESQSVQFPEPAERSCNMMPFIMGEYATLPETYHPYIPLIEKCDFEEGTTVYLTVQESEVVAGQTQRRDGVHTEAFKAGSASEESWGGGGGSWGGGDGAKKDKDTGGWGGGGKGGWGSGGCQLGVYMASTDGACRYWQQDNYNVDSHGALMEDLPVENSIKCQPSTLYWISDRTPHEALPSPSSGVRQFFRLVSSELGTWFAEHNTPNPLGVEADTYICYGNKFE